MSDNLVISISREYGSGGREIGEKLAAALGIAYYDRELLKRVAEKSGFCDEVVEAHDEKPVKRMLFNPYSFVTGLDTDNPVAVKIRTSEIELIRSLVNDAPCVIIGRCADSVLTECPGLISLFVSAPMPNRISRVMRRNNLTEREAKTRITKTDKSRASYYRYFADKEWGVASSYDLCINSGSLSADGAVEVIAQYIKSVSK